MFTTKFTTKKSNLNKGYLEGANLERTELEARKARYLSIYMKWECLI
jgi:hypothetical protein